MCVSKCGDTIFVRVGECFYAVDYMQYTESGVHFDGKFSHFLYSIVTTNKRQDTTFVALGTVKYKYGGHVKKACVLRTSFFSVVPISEWFIFCFKFIFVVEKRKSPKCSNVNYILMKQSVILHMFLLIGKALVRFSRKRLCKHERSRRLIWKWKWMWTG